MKEKLKGFLKGFWEVIVLFAYMKFYMLCLIGTMLSILSSMWILANAGHDITHIPKGLKWVGYLGITYVAIIMADKLARQYKEGKKK